MIPFSLAIPTEIFRQPLKKSIMLAAQTGVTGVQLDDIGELKPAELSETGRRQFLHSLKEVGLSVAAVKYRTRHPLAYEENLDARVAGLKSAMQTAAQLRAKKVTVRLGKLPDEDDSKTNTTLVNILNDVAQWGNHIGVIVALSVATTAPQQLEQLLAKITTGRIGLNFDPVSCLMAGTSPAEILKKFHSQIEQVTGRDAFADVDGLTQETVLGMGQVDWNEIVAMLYESGYQQWLIIDRQESENRLNDVRQGIQFLKQIGM
ncbi:hypothetical protein MNBD_PLANCTO02-3324 [hydrothermal vent metagenome]|uniref:Xylose isomerase-like TIM barrel domain-containing protein n=1 Tax=hydrothermal vent metagenome TaxID=652676 RepID=A0A3B1DUL8_9ZZZZ